MLLSAYAGKVGRGRHGGAVPVRCRAAFALTAMRGMYCVYWIFSCQGTVERKSSSHFYSQKTGTLAGPVFCEILGIALGMGQGNGCLHLHSAKMGIVQPFFGKYLWMGKIPSLTYRKNGGLVQMAFKIFLKSFASVKKNSLHPYSSKPGVLSKGFYVKFLRETLQRRFLWARFL